MKMRVSTRFFCLCLVALFCLCLLAGLVPGMGTTAYATGSYKLGDTVEFGGYEWYVIGTETEGVTAPSGSYTLFAKNNDFGSTAFRANASSTDSTANYYKDSDLYNKMNEIANSFSTEDKANIVARDTLDGINGSEVTNQLVWPISLTELYKFDATLRKFPANYGLRSVYNRSETLADGTVITSYYVDAVDSNGYRLGGPSSTDGTYQPSMTETYAARPALYVSAEALPEPLNPSTTEIRMIAFGGEWWYVVGEGASGSVPGPTDTVTLFQYSYDNGISYAYASTSTTYLGSNLQQKMENYGSNLNFAGKESSLIVSRTLTEDDEITGGTVENQPFWPLSRFEFLSIGNTEILKCAALSMLDYYWLRTTSDSSSYTVYAGKTEDGTLTSTSAAAGWTRGVRPAFYLDISNAFYCAPDAKPDAIGGKPRFFQEYEDITYWKYTLFDDDLKLAMTATPTQQVQTGSSLSFGYAATTGTDLYLSCVLSDASGEVLYYNTLVDLGDDSAASGIVNIPVTGVSDGNYTLRLYTEQKNLVNTDFASQTVDAEIAVQNGVASIVDLGDISPVADSGSQSGREVELRNNGTYIQWRYAGEDDTAWRNLVALDELTGADGQDGADGQNGTDGADGQDGTTPQLRVNSQTNMWEVSYDDGDTWTSLGVKATGADGQDGQDGINGTNGTDGQDGKDGVDGQSGGTVALYVLTSISLAGLIGVGVVFFIKRKVWFGK